LWGLRSGWDFETDLKAGPQRTTNLIMIKAV